MGRIVGQRPRRRNGELRLSLPGAALLPRFRPDVITVTSPGTFAVQKANEVKL